VDKQEAKKMKSALGVLKAVLTWACRERSKYLGEPPICLRGNQLSYSSLEGTTAGVNLPGLRVDGEPVYVRASLVKAALAAMPGEMHIDYANCTINGLSFSVQEGKELHERCPTVDVNQTFGRVKTLAVIPMPEVLNEVRVAESRGDIRYYLNGTCFDLERHAVVSTNGHRMHVANSDTLPDLKPEVLDALRRQIDVHDVRACQFILAGWQLDLLNKMGATQLSVGRFPVQAKGDASIPCWQALDAKTPCYLVRSKAEFGFFIGKSIDGYYPDWNRVAPSVNAIEVKRNIALAMQAKLKAYFGSTEEPGSMGMRDQREELIKGYPHMIKYPATVTDELREQIDTANLNTIAANEIEWRTSYPRLVEFPADSVAILRRYIKAATAVHATSKAKESGMGVVIDLRDGVVRSRGVEGIPLNMPIRVLDELEYDGDRADHLAGVNAEYLADALEYVGLENWYVAAGHAFVAHNDSRTAVVMPVRA